MLENENIKETVEETIVEEIDDTVKSQTQQRAVYGIVSGCGKLNIRESSSKDSDILCVIDEGSVVSIDFAKSTEDWLSICTNAGIDGFCMAKFIDF